MTELWGPEATEESWGPLDWWVCRIPTTSWIDVFAQGAIFELRFYFKCPSILLTRAAAGNQEDQSPGLELAVVPRLLCRLAPAQGAQGTMCTICFHVPPSFTTGTKLFTHYTRCSTVPLNFIHRIRASWTWKGTPCLSYPHSP